MKIIDTWPVVGAKSNSPMALDEANNRLFVGCLRRAKVIVYDTAVGKETGSFDTVGDSEDLFYDAARKRLYVSGGEGYFDVFQEQDAKGFTRMAHVATAAGARTSLFVPEHRASTLPSRTGATRSWDPNLRSAMKSHVLPVIDRVRAAAVVHSPCEEPL